MTPDKNDAVKETILLENIPPPIEDALVAHARLTGTDPSSAATQIIERHLEEEGSLFA